MGPGGPFDALQHGRPEHRAEEPRKVYADKDSPGEPRCAGMCRSELAPARPEGGACRNRSKPSPCNAGQASGAVTHATQVPRLRAAPGPVAAAAAGAPDLRGAEQHAHRFCRGLQSAVSLYSSTRDDQTASSRVMVEARSWGVALSRGQHAALGSPRISGRALMVAAMSAANRPR